MEVYICKECGCAFLNRKSQKISYCPEHRRARRAPEKKRRIDGWIKCKGHCGETWHSPDRINRQVCPRCTEQNRGVYDGSEYTLRL